MKAIIGVNVKLEVQETLDTPITISAISQATDGSTVVTATNSFNDGDVVVFNITDGMAQLDRQAARVVSATGSDFVAENVDITGFETFTAGTVTKISQFATLAAARQVTAPNPAPTKLDTTTLIDFTPQFEYGLPGAPDGSITCLFNPGGATELLIDSATNSHADMVIRLTYADGRQTVTNALVSGGAGFDLGQNAVGQATVAFTPVKYMKHYQAVTP